MESYIVRIYRRGRNGILVGIVETAIGGWQKPFRNAQELTSILVAPKRRSEPAVREPEAKSEEKKTEPPYERSGTEKSSRSL